MLDPAQLKSKATYARPGAFYSLAGNLANGKLYAGNSDHSIQVFDLAAETNEKKEPAAVWTKHDNFVSALAFVPRPPARLAVSGSYDRTLVWWDTDLGEVVRTVAAHEGWVRGLEPFPDGRRLASVGDDMVVRLWETDSGKPVGVFAGHALRTPQGHPTALYAVAISPDGRFVASGDRIGEVRVWESDSGKLAQMFQVPILYTYDPRQRKRSIGGIRSLTFSPDGGRLAIGGMGQVENVDGMAGKARIEIWDWRRPGPLAALEGEGHKGIVNHLQFVGNDWLVGAGGGSDDGFLAVWRPDTTPGAVATAAATAGATTSAEPSEIKPSAPARLIKTGGHTHRFVLHEAAGELYAAGHGKLEVWTWR
jgi:WD40 repeat protein